MASTVANSFTGRESIHFSTSDSTSTDHMTSGMISRRLGSTESASRQGHRPDTIYGQIVGAHYGAEAIPAAWRDKLTMVAEITSLADRLDDQAALHPE